jgi:hypothetical protein
MVRSQKTAQYRLENRTFLFVLCSPRQLSNVHINQQFSQLSPAFFRFAKFTVSSPPSYPRSSALIGGHFFGTRKQATCRAPGVDISQYEISK